MDSSTTFVMFAVGVGMTLVAAWGDHVRRRKPDAPLALLPWHALLFAGVAVMLFMVAHALTLVRE